MKKLDLGQTISIIANIGVIAGILFLAYELRQNNRLMEAGSRTARAERITSVSEMVSATPALAEVLARARNGESLTDSEDLMIYSFYMRRLRGFEAFFSEFQAGTVNGIQADNWRLNFYADPWTGKSLADSWSRLKLYLNPDFVQWMEENVIEPGPP